MVVVILAWSSSTVKSNMLSQTLFSLTVILLSSQNQENGISADWSFIEKTSVKQDPKPLVCSNFQMSFLHLSQTDLPGRDMSWPRVVLSCVWLT